MKRIGFFGVLALAMVVALGTSPAAAQGPYCGGGWGGCGINFPYGLYGSRVNDVPYFAMFPPVYYSMPVPRTYGWSPFAYPPGTMTPEVEPEMPAEIINPYVPESKANGQVKPTRSRTASYRAPVAQVLINPYVRTTKLAASSGSSTPIDTH